MLRDATGCPLKKARCRRHVPHAVAKLIATTAARIATAAGLPQGALSGFIRRGLNGLCFTAASPARVPAASRQMGTTAGARNLVGMSWLKAAQTAICATRIIASDASHAFACRAEAITMHTAIPASSSVSGES